MQFSYDKIQPRNWCIAFVFCRFQACVVLVFCFFWVFFPEEYWLTKKTLWYRMRKKMFVPLDNVCMNCRDRFLKAIYERLDYCTIFQKVLFFVQFFHLVSLALDSCCPLCTLLKVIKHRLCLISFFPGLPFPGDWTWMWSGLIASGVIPHSWSSDALTWWFWVPRRNSSTRK